MPDGEGDWVQKVRDWKINELLGDPPPVITAVIRGGALLFLVVVIIYAMNQISESGSDGAGELFQVFFLLVVLGGSVGAVAYWLMKRDLYASADQRVNRKAQKLRDDLADFTRQHVRYHTVLAEAKSLQGMSFTFFDSYEIALQKILDGSDPSCFPSEKHEVVLAKALVHHALTCFENPLLALSIENARQPSSQLSENDSFAYRHHTNLLNHSIYHAMALCIFKAGVRDSEEDTPVIGDQEPEITESYNKLVVEAQRYVDLLQDARLAEQLYELQDTLGTCFALSPDSDIRKQGKKLLTDIITGTNPTWSAPNDLSWRIERWKEHNPRFKLGIECPT